MNCEREEMRSWCIESQLRWTDRAEGVWLGEEVEESGEWVNSVGERSGEVEVRVCVGGSCLCLRRSCVAPVCRRRGHSSSPITLSVCRENNTTLHQPTMREMTQQIGTKYVGIGLPINFGNNKFLHKNLAVCYRLPTIMRKMAKKLPPNAV